MATDADEPGKLARLYARMSDSELQQLAKDPGSLTDAAQNALEAEVRNRRAAIGPRDWAADGPDTPDISAGTEELQLRNLVTIRKFRDLPEALLAKGSLESAGIECFLADDNMVRMDWFISNFIGGVKLQVKADDGAIATEILDQPIPEDFEVEGSGEYRQPKCPNCQSVDVSFEELNKPVAFVSASIGLPFPLHRKAWRCHSCGREWEDLDPHQSQEP
ncbi:MAG: DUF2007 domain-containing protein [Terriglobales bacterium]